MTYPAGTTNIENDGTPWKCEKHLVLLEQHYRTLVSVRGSC